MLEKPDISEKLITSFIQSAYALDVRQATFLPLGYDVNTAVYRVVDQGGASYFLKLRKGDFLPVTVELPKYLSQAGLDAIIAPIETRHAELYGRMATYTAILSPFIAGMDGYQVRLADQHWILLGHVLRQVHDTQLPIQLARQIPSETYDPQWRRSARGFLTQAADETFLDPVAQNLAAFMREKNDLIASIIQRTDELAADLQEQHLEFVLCHSDAHPGNYLIAGSGELYLVDWDNPIFAPRERDLMCFGAAMSGDQPGGREEQLFFQGYGAVEVNLSALAYYRFERIIQDIAEFCKQLLLSDKGGEDRQQSYQYFVSSFQPGGVVEAAFHTHQQARLRL